MIFVGIFLPLAAVFPRLFCRCEVVVSGVSVCAGAAKGLGDGEKNENAAKSSEGFFLAEGCGVQWVIDGLA